MDKASLLRPHLPEAEVELPGGGTVRVRALSTAETHKLKAVGDDSDRLETLMLTWSMVEPELSEDEVGQWRAGAPVGETQTVVERVVELSGMQKDAQKDAETSFRSGA